MKNCLGLSVNGGGVGVGGKVTSLVGVKRP